MMATFMGLHCYIVSLVCILECIVGQDVNATLGT